MNFNGPIPGQSLTREPGGSPWEQPPLYSDNNQVIAYYMDKLGDEDKMQDMLNLLDQGIPLNTLVESMTTMGVMNGIHTVDSSILVGPVLHEYIKELADSADINLTEWNEPTPAEKAKIKEKQNVNVMLSSQLRKSPTNQSPTTVLNPTPPANKPVTPPTSGLINRRP